MRSVGEQVAEMTAARGAHHLGAHHPERRVRLLVDRLLARRRVEGRPAAAGVVLRVGAEELGAATGAPVRAGLEDVVVLAGEGTLGPLLAQYTELLGRQLLAPLLLRLLDLCVLCFLHAQSSPGLAIRYTEGILGRWSAALHPRRFL